MLRNSPIGGLRQRPRNSSATFESTMTASNIRIRRKRDSVLISQHFPTELATVHTRNPPKVSFNRFLLPLLGSFGPLIDGSFREFRQLFIRVRLLRKRRLKE